MFRFFIVLLCCATTLLATRAGSAQPPTQTDKTFRVMSFNILQGGGNAANIGFSNERFGGSRYDELAAVIQLSQADIVGIQEDAAGDELLAALGEGWHRGGSIYSKFPLQLLHADIPSVCRVQLSPNESVIIVNCHWAPYPYGPYDIQKSLQESGAPEDVAKFEKQILDGARKTEGVRAYEPTMAALRPHLKAGERVILTGDFNEPSHLDWTEQAAANGLDRWVKNPTGVPLRFVIPWEGSRLLHELGLKDAYRGAHPDEVASPGITWTPVYAEGTVGRRSYDDQVLDRIDMIYYAGEKLRVVSAATIGESAKFAEVVYPGDWPSDHRAVVAEFELPLK